LNQVDGPFARLPQCFLGAPKNALAIHRVPHVRIHRWLIAERDIEHPVFDFGSANQQSHQPPVIDHDPACFTGQTEFIFHALDEMRWVMIFGERQIDPVTLGRIGRARDAQVVVGEIVLGAILIVVARNGVEAHRDRQLRHFLFGLLLLRARLLVGSLDPPSIFNVRLVRHTPSF